MAFLFSFHCDSPDQGSVKSRSGKFSLPRSAHLGEAVANLLGVQRWLLPGGEMAPPVPDVVMDQVWHPPIDPAPRGAVGLARIYADAYGKLQSGRCDVGQFGRCDSGHASSLLIRMTSLTITGVLVCSNPMLAQPTRL